MTSISDGRTAAPTRRGRLHKPNFLPDATRAVVKGLDSEDLESVGVRSVMVNAFHLANRPGTGAVRSVGRVHKFMGWNGSIWTDSGGFQLFSLIRENSANGRISDDGFTHFAQGRGRKLLTPSKSIANQWRLGSDVLFCLDQCTHPSDSRSAQEESVRRTIRWAKSCKAEFVKRCESSRLDDTSRPLLFGVVQGGEERDLRARCAEALLEIGFDGFGFGGWPINEDGGLVDMVYRVAELIPPKFPLHGLGIGRPDNIISAWKAGYRTFDSALPTRNARRGRLLVAGNLSAGVQGDPDFFDYMFITEDQYYRDDRPVDETCPGPCCTRYSRAYLHHLFRIGDVSAQRLATIHNLIFMQQLMEATIGHVDLGDEDEPQG